MEKIKWIILALLAIVLLVVVFFNKDENLPKLSNFVEFSVKHIDKKDSNIEGSLINEGNFVLLLDEIQIVKENALGFHIEFSLPVDKEKMIFVFDLVDTSSVLQNKNFPYSFTNSNYFAEHKAPLVNFYRSYAKIGFSQTLSTTFKKENTVHFVSLFSIVENFVIDEDKVNLELSFIITHSDLLEDIFKFRYLVSGKISISNAHFTERVISFN